MSKVHGPELKKYLDKSLSSMFSQKHDFSILTHTYTHTVKLNGNRKVTGVLRGFDQFMNLVLDNTVEEVSPSERNDIGMVVRASWEAEMHSNQLYCRLFEETVL